MPRTSGPAVLLLFDGWGYRAESLGNAVAEAETPNYDQLWEAYPHTLLAAAGLAVGLAEGSVGNAVAGYDTLAAGHAVEQPALLVHRAVSEGRFITNEVILNSARAALARGGTIHLVGQVSDGQVVSAEEQYFALLRLCQQAGVPGDRVVVHAILDGHDTPPRSGLNYLARFAAEMMRTGIGRVATLMGRWYGMSEEGSWEATERAYAALVHGAGRLVPSAIQALQAGYSRGEDDFTLSPAVVLGADGLPLGRVGDGDLILAFNVRGEGLERLFRALLDKQFRGFEREQQPAVEVVCLTDYPYAADLGCQVAFPSPPPAPRLGQVLQRAGRRYGVVAESYLAPYLRRLAAGVPDDQVIARFIESPPAAEILGAPQRLADELSAAAVELIARRECDLLVVSYLNADLAGHSGDVGAAREAIEALDGVLPPLIRAARRAGATVFVTACYGNVEELGLPSTARPNPAHTANPVPLIIVNDALKGQHLPASGDRSLADLAPTILGLFELPAAPGMTGADLFDLLKPLDPRSAESNVSPAPVEIGALEALDMVLAMERSAVSYYRGAADRAGDPDSASLYRHLADEEQRRLDAVNHRHDLLSLNQSHVHEEYAVDSPAALPSPRLQPLEVLEAAVKEEVQTYRILTELAARNLDPQGTAVLEQMAQDELELLARLQQLCESEEIRILAALPQVAAERAAVEGDL